MKGPNADKSASPGGDTFSIESMQLAWDQKYSVGIRKIDSQHKRVVGILNQLRWISKDKEEKELKSIFEQLKGYIETHFQQEEDLMLEYQYPGYQEQKSEHEAFIDRFCEYERDILKRRKMVVINIFNFLADWFTNHILKVDMKY